MSLSRLAIGGLLALGFVGVSANAAQAQHYYHHGYAPRVYVAPYYAPPVIVRPPVVVGPPVVAPPVVVAPSYGYYPGYAPSTGYAGASFGIGRPGYSFGFSFGNYFR